MPRALALALSWLCIIAPLRGDDLVAALKDFDATVGASDGQKLSEAVPADISRRLREANAHSTADWRKIETLDQWADFRRQKLELLRKSLGDVAPVPEKVDVRRTGKIESDGFVIENVLISGRPGEWITANLYRPAEQRETSPGILICHSHHNPKTESELQAMGATWARAGCYVLVMDQVGHGERRQHPFRNAASYPHESFRVGRQDYWFRYDLSLQAYLAGGSLMGLMVQDLTRGVDFLLDLPGIDRDKIILLGAVAGGGDPAAVAGALDERITAVVPFNFGGPQPETKYPLPESAEASFGYAGSGSWESTRNLAHSASERFLPWVIVGSIAPRKLVYAHEFSWDRERDPVWKRLQQVYSWHGVADSLDFADGTGLLSGQAPEASHCNNIGAVHRRHLHRAFQHWFGIEVNPDEEYRKTIPAEKLHCVTADSPPAGVVREVYKTAATDSLKDKETAMARWKHLLGDVEARKVQVSSQRFDPEKNIRHVLLAAEVPIPLIVLQPKQERPAPVVVGVAQQGKQKFLVERASVFADLLKQGIAVCMVDVRGTGETAVAGGHDRTSYATSLSASEMMLGSTMLQQQVRDLRMVIGYLRSVDFVDGDRIALWGDSFAATNARDRELVVPHGVERPATAEPMGGLLVLLAALFEPDLRAVAVHRGLSSYASAFEGPCVYLPHDCVIPGAAVGGDVAGLVAGVADRPIRMWEPVNALNREVSPESTTPLFKAALEAQGSQLQLSKPSDQELVAWFVKHLASGK